MHVNLKVLFRSSEDDQVLTARVFLTEAIRQSEVIGCLPHVTSFMLHMFSCVPLLSICLLVNAARLDDLFDITSANGADDLRNLIDFVHSGLSNHENSNFIAMGQETSEETSEEAPQSRRKRRRRGRGKGGKGPNSGGPSGEQVSADEMQRGLLEFLKQHHDTGGLPEYKDPPEKYKALLSTAKAKAKGWKSWKVPPSSCLEQLGGLLQELNSMCWKTMKGKMVLKQEIIRDGIKLPKEKYEFKNLRDVPIPTCNENVEGLFLHGRDVVRVQQVGNDFAKDTPTATKPLLQAGLFLQEWIIKLATANKAAILWAGFWTNATWHHLARLEPERCR